MKFGKKQVLQRFLYTHPISSICRVNGELLKKTNEIKNIRWISLDELSLLLDENESYFYPMHIITLKKYLELKNAEVPAFQFQIL